MESQEDKAIQNSASPDAASIVELYRNYAPHGEIVLNYTHPANEAFAPLSYGHFGNVSKLLFRSGWLWSASTIACLAAAPVWEVIALSCGPTVRHLTRVGTPVVMATMPQHLHPLHHVPVDLPIPALIATMLTLMFVLPVLILTMVSITYLTICFLNLFLQYGTRVMQKLRAPTQIALSKASAKLAWSGILFRQYGAMLGWNDILAIDYAPAEDCFSSARILIKYKLPEGEVIMPFSLSGFGSDQEAILFMEMADEYVPDEAKASGFKTAFADRQATVKIGRMDALDAITSGANTFSPISQQSQVNAEPLSDAGAAAETEPLHKTEPAMSISAEAGMVRAFIDTLKMTQAVNEEQACVRPEPQNSEPQSLLDALAASSNAGAKIDISDSAAKAIPVAAQTRNRSSMTE